MAIRRTGRSQQPFDLEGIDHILLVVDDMAAAKRFYERVIGCVVEVDYPEYGMAQLRAGAALINLVDVSIPQGAWARTVSPRGQNMDHLCLALGAHDAAALRRHLEKHGVGIEEESFHAGARGESLSIYVRDPSGNMLELKGPPAG